MEVRGYATAAEWVYGQAVNRIGHCHPDAILSLAEVRQVHHTALSPVWEVTPHPDATDRETPGNFRQNDIRPFPGGMTPVSWPLVFSEMDTWVEEINKLDAASLSFPESLAEAHCRFEQIHPFLDGNGRTGRLLLNLILVRLGYPPAIIYKRERSRYLDGLRKAERGDTGPLGEMLARAILDNLYRFVIPAIAGPARLVPLSALATPNLKAPALRAAAGRGRLRAVRNASGRWRSSRAWVEEYKASRYDRDRHKRGRKGE
ncbi:MAG: Fic family protein [Gemmatimonadetes bacterium]|nr:Fic family protein [Gemmatimonadota bacterium]MYB97014.1 Fic family protein [Gemmatimonadota bacterium]MYI46906.1 Fic family protein [Gemmatimonadota bacterium]